MPIQGANQSHCSIGLGLSLTHIGPFALNLASESSLWIQPTALPSTTTECVSYRTASTAAVLPMVSRGIASTSNSDRL
jgi:hypothetical protein